MTKKDYIAIASVLQSHLKAERSGDSYDIVDGIADILAKDNPSFSYCRFKVACEPIEGGCKG